MPSFFRSLAEQREELEVAHGLASAENLSLQQKLSFYELALAMESYPSAPPASLGSQIEQQMKSAALELISLRNENASLKDQAPLPTLPLQLPPLLRPSFSCLPPCLYPCRSPCPSLASRLPLAYPSPVLQPTALRLILRVGVEAVIEGDVMDATHTHHPGTACLLPLFLGLSPLNSLPPQPPPPSQSVSNPICTHSRLSV